MMQICWVVMYTTSVRCVCFFDVEASLLILERGRSEKLHGRLQNSPSAIPASGFVRTVGNSGSCAADAMRRGREDGGVDQSEEVEVFSSQVLRRYLPITYSQGIRVLFLGAISNIKGVPYWGFRTGTLFLALLYAAFP
jgi:hypothetical protein